jgi:hypothetical protein
MIGNMISELSDKAYNERDKDMVLWKILIKREVKQVFDSLLEIDAQDLDPRRRRASGANIIPSSSPQTYTSFGRAISLHGDQEVVEAVQAALDPGDDIQDDDMAVFGSTTEEDYGHLAGSTDPDLDMNSDFDMDSEFDNELGGEEDQGNLKRFEDDA